ncbi:MAG: cyclic nucleotide-binding domain-containing protein [Planctomycetes bacterium]|nr:cyclic nucleotide-binding domain-containing protein [Planctomycetota bacterium]MBI3846600.1 cyclic nucleotide-binding domain-containing protein [Planctomycetota bacterium]
MLLTIEKVIFLKSVSIFSAIPEDALIEVATAIEELDVPSGEEIVRKGEYGTSMYIIVEGRVRVHDGDRELGVLGEREVFGELAALDPVPRSASVTALEDSYVFRMSQSALYSLIEQHMDVARGILRILCQRIRDCDERISALSSNQPRTAKSMADAPGRDRSRDV